MTSTTQTRLEAQRKNGKIYSYARGIWLVETPEESVRQEYLCTLVNEYGFKLEQIAEEVAVPSGRGAGNARADFLIWRTPKDKADGKTAFIVVECKADNVTIDAKVYEQGANYAQYERAQFFVTHNNRETKYWRVDLERRMPNFDEIENIPHANDSDREIEALLGKLKVFKEDEFAKLLHECHNVIRNREKLDPAAAFDEIAKVLFVKVYVEREMKAKRQRRNLFSQEFLDDQLGDDPVNDLFEKTKRAYQNDQIFAKEDSINLKPATSKEIVKKLERYNLSDTSEDIKGIAFERFLGRTFRGEIGQFFTPRTIVEFMIRMVEPKEGDIICDPASGSGGFLIRFFEIVREQILADADHQYQEFKAKTESSKLPEAKKAERLREKYEEIQETIDQRAEGSRLMRLANLCIFGTDANERMARTSKMNMIMHGDGHGGVHHHEGFLNVNGIFEGRFNIVLTNPPFGANVEQGDKVPEAVADVPPATRKRYREEYGELYTESLQRLKAAAAAKKSIAEMFKLPKTSQSKIKTELLFLERCLDLLQPGGRLGIVLPEGVFNNPSLQYVREFCEDRAFIRAVVSLPQETFYSSGASVKASLLFMQKFTDAEQAGFDRKKKAAKEETQDKYQSQLDELQAVIDRPNYLTSHFLAGKAKPTPEEKRAANEQARAANEELRQRRADAKQAKREMEERIRRETRALLKERFPYAIFLYDAEKVGITATGEQDLNELYPNDSQPPGFAKTCLELFQEFKQDAQPFFVTGFRD